MTKTCSRCKMAKPVSDFSKRSQSKDGLHYLCKDCKHAGQKAWYDDHREQAIAESLQRQRVNKTRHAVSVRKYEASHKEAKKIRGKLYYSANRDRIREQERQYQKERRAVDVDYRMKGLLKGRIRAALKGNRKSAHTLELIGCSIEELRLHLERQFVVGMTWENYGYDGWHIDHIRPCASFDLSKPEQQRVCFHFTNLQPLWAADNKSKRDRIAA